MRNALIAILLLSSYAADAQIKASYGTEPPRNEIRPYTTPAEAVTRPEGASRYISPLNEWQRDEKEGRTIFSASYVYPIAWLNRQLLLRIEAASAGYRVVINGSEIGRASNGAVPTEFNLTKRSKQGINEISLILDAPTDGEPLLKTGVAWIGRAEVLSQPTIRLREATHYTRLNDAGDGIAEISLAVKTDALNPKTSRIYYELLAPDTTRLAYGYKDITLEMRGEDTVKFAAIIPRDKLWSTDNPVLLTLTVRNRIDGKYTETVAIPTGLHSTEYASGRLVVNGKPVSLKIATVEPNVTVSDLAELKSEGINTVTVKAGEAPLSLYSVCDSVGMYVIPQLAADTSEGGESIKRGGNPSNDPSMTAEYLDRAAAMYHTSKTHPSVIAFSLGGGRTNGINMYETYLALKRSEHGRPIIYTGAGREWNNDTFDMRYADKYAGAER